MTTSPTTIWFDQTNTTTVKKTNSAIHISLCKSDPYLVTFRDADKCIDYVRNIKDEENKIILIISDETAPNTTLLRRSEELPQIDSVYILNLFNTESFETMSKIRGVYTDLESLCDHLKQLPNIQRRRKEGFVGNDFILNVFARLPIPYTSQLTSPLSNDTDTKRQETEFMYAQMLRDILVAGKSTEKEMIDFCRQKCAGNKTYLNTIDEFEEYYDACNAIFWYTRDTFLYRLLNKALREQDFDTLYSLRYFIKDLHFQIIKRGALQTLLSFQLATTSNMSGSNMLSVYRGQLMTNEEFNKKIRNNEGGFLSISSFFSTTIHKHLAIVYAGNRSSNTTSTEQSVLFQIKMDKNYYDYANISKESAFEEDEGEILFTMGVVFQITSIDLSEGFWNVKLHLNTEEDTELTTLMAHMRAKIMSPYPLQSLGRWMLETANYDKAEQFYMLLLEELTISEKYDIIAAVYNDLGFIYKKTGKHVKAIHNYEKSLDTSVKYLSPTDVRLAYVYNNLGAVYAQQSDYDKALLYHNKALEIALNSPEPDKNETTIYYNSIGVIYQAQERYSEALEMFEKLLQFLEKRSPVNHPSLAVCYNNISQVHCALRNYDKATEYIEKALTIQQRSLSTDHPDLATSYNNLGIIYDAQKMFKEALEMYEKALQIQFNKLPLEHPAIATTYNNISQVHYALRMYDQAIYYLHKTLEIQIITLLPNHLDVARTYKNLSLAFSSLDKANEALEYIKLAYEIHSQYLQADHPHIIDDLRFINYLEKSLDAAVVPEENK